jgi:curved DNA-binding protein CbpA
MAVGLTLYDVLGIPTDATTDHGSSLFSSLRPASLFLHGLFAVRKAYKTKALETHPDKLEPTATNRERRAAEGKFRNV